jgi:hypothetical protein
MTDSMHDKSEIIIIQRLVLFVHAAVHGGVIHHNISASS